MRVFQAKAAGVSKTTPSLIAGVCLSATSRVRLAYAAADHKARSPCDTVAARVGKIAQGVLSPLFSVGSRGAVPCKRENLLRFKAYTGAAQSVVRPKKQCQNNTFPDLKSGDTLPHTFPDSPLKRGLQRKNRQPERLAVEVRVSDILPSERFFPDRFVTAPVGRSLPHPSGRVP